MLKRFVILLLLLANLTACGEKGEPVIGVVNLNASEGAKSVVRINYFESKDDARDYYHKKGILDYVLMVHPEQEEKSVFEQIDAKEEAGMKTVEFTAENAALAADQAFAFLYDELGLGIECAFDGKECK